MKIEKSKLFEILIGLAETYNKELSQAALEIYWMALNKYSKQEIDKAVLNIIETHKFATFPTPAEFLDSISPKDDIEFKAELATDELYEHLADPYKSFEFKDPVIGLVIEHLGGWEYVCETFPRYADQAKEQTFWIKNFKDVYKGFAKRPIPDQSIKMIGAIERTNGDNNKMLQSGNELKLIPLKDIL